MPMIPFQPNTRIRSADVNANFANALALDTPRTVIVTHTWNALQVFGQGIQVSGASTFGGDVTVNGSFDVSGGLTAAGVISAGRFKATGGNAAAPSYQLGEDGYGIYRSGNRIDFAINDSDRLSIGAADISARGGAAFTGNGDGLTNLRAGELTGTVAAGVNVPAARLTGTIALGRIPGLPASRVTTGEMAIARLPLLQFAVVMESFNVAPRSTSSFVLETNGVTPASAAFANVQETVITGFIVVTARQCRNNAVVVGYFNHLDRVETVPAHTLRIGVLRFQ